MGYMVTTLDEGYGKEGNGADNELAAGTVDGGIKSGSGQVKREGKHISRDRRV